MPISIKLDIKGVVDNIKANIEGLSFEEVSKKYIKEFWTDAHGLNFKDATVHPKATENIDEIINIIKKTNIDNLLKKKFYDL